MEDLIMSAITNAPNFIGFIIAVILQHRALSQSQATVARLTEAIIKRENCDDEHA